MSGPGTPPQQGTDTYQTGDKSGGKHGIKGARERLWSDEFGGGMMNRQIIPEELMQMLMQGASGQTVSPAAMLAQAGLGQMGNQAYGLAAAAPGGMGVAQSFGQAQQTQANAGLAMLPQYAAMNADWQQGQQQLLAQSLLGQQSLNDAAGISREQMLQGLVSQMYAGRMGQQQSDRAFWGQLGGGLLGAAGAIGGGAMMGGA